MSWLRNAVAVAASALVVIVFAWLYGGMRGSELVSVVPWIEALLLEVMFAFPQQEEGETSYQARDRVWKKMKRDPLTWVCVGFVLLLMIPFANYGLCPYCDVAEIAAGHPARPPFSFLPYCVNRLHHLTTVLWFVPAVTAVIAIKHSLNAAGKRALVETLAWNAAVLTLFGFVQQVYDAKGPLWNPADGAGGACYFFSTFGYPNAGGPFFVSCFALGVAVWRWNDSAVHDLVKAKDPDIRNVSAYSLFWRRHYMAIPTVLALLGALNTLCRAAIMTVIASAVVLAAHAAICLFARLKKAARVRAVAMMGLAAVALAFAVSVFTPEKLRKEVSTIDTVGTLDRVTDRGGNNTKVAIDLMWDHPLFGCGGWGYAHLAQTKMPKEGKKTSRRWFSPGTANVHNDYLQFLAEHGMVGFGCLVAIAVMLLMPVVSTWSKLVKLARFEKTASKRPPKPVAVFALPAGAFAVLVGAAVILVHAFGDCPLRSPAVLSLFFAELAAASGFLSYSSNNH